MKVDWKLQNSNRIHLPSYLPTRHVEIQKLQSAARSRSSPLQCCNLATDGHQLGKMSLTVAKKKQPGRKRLLKPAADTFNYNFKVKICCRSDVHAMSVATGSGRWFEICQLFSLLPSFSRSCFMNAGLVEIGIDLNPDGCDESVSLT